MASRDACAAATNEAFTEKRRRQSIYSQVKSLKNTEQGAVVNGPARGAVGEAGDATPRRPAPPHVDACYSSIDFRVQ